MFGNGLKSRKIPKVTKYGQEAPDVQMRIIRTHMAGQADTLSTILTIVQDIQQRVRVEQEDRAARLAQLDDAVREMDAR